MPVRLLNLVGKEPVHLINLSTSHQLSPLQHILNCVPNFISSLSEVVDAAHSSPFKSLYFRLPAWFGWKIGIRLAVYICPQNQITYWYTIAYQRYIRTVDQWGVLRWLQQIFIFAALALPNSMTTIPERQLVLKTLETVLADNPILLFDPRTVPTV